MIYSYIIKLFNWYKGLSLPVKAGVWFTFCNFLLRGITMLTTPIFTRILSKEQYGIISVFTTWQSIFVLVGTLSLCKAQMKLYVKYNDKERILSSLCFLSIIISFIWFVIFALFFREIPDLLGLPYKLVICLVLSILINGGLNCWLVHQRYIYNYATIILLTIFQTIISTIISVICVLTISPTAESRLIPSTVIGLIVSIIIYISVFRNNKTLFDKDNWLFSITFSFCLMPHYISEFILQGSDKLMINKMCGFEDTAIYSIAYSVGSIITLLTSSINSSFAPYQYQQIKSKNYKDLAKSANDIFALVAIVLILVMLFSREIVILFGSYKYIDSVKAIIPICLGIFFNYMFQIFSRVQEYFENKATVVISSLLCAVLNIILNYIYIKRDGYIAASYTTFICYFSFCILHYYFYKKVCNKELNGQGIYDIRGLCLISLLLILSAILVYFINQYLMLKYIIIITLLIILIIHRKKILKIITRKMVY